MTKVIKFSSGGAMVDYLALIVAILALMLAGLSYLKSAHQPIIARYDQYVLSPQAYWKTAVGLADDKGNKMPLDDLNTKHAVHHSVQRYKVATDLLRRMARKELDLLIDIAQGSHETYANCLKKIWGGEKYTPSNCKNEEEDFITSHENLVELLPLIDPRLF